MTRAPPTAILRASIGKAATKHQLMKHYSGGRQLHAHKTRKASDGGRKRCNIELGSVLIVLAGKYRGRRVVFLKQLPTSGLLLVTGPHCVNGVPLRRMNRAYVISTKQRVDVDNLDLGVVGTDEYFKRERSAKTNGGDDQDGAAAFFAKSGRKSRPAGFQLKKRSSLPENKKAEQKRIDALLMPKIKAVPQLRNYLGAHFSLAKGQFPHLLKW